MILFLEGQASQREVILGARAALPAPIKIFASHHDDRPEITSHADVALREPKDPKSRPEWALEVAIKNSIKVVHAGRKADLYEALRSDFELHGIELVTGARSLDTFAIEDKDVFARRCGQSYLRCTPHILVSTEKELADAIDLFAANGPVCVKPATGIYGQGFWRIERDFDPFRCLSKPDDRRVDAGAFVQLYRASKKREPLLVMPYLPGDEVSVDVVCESGKPVAWVGRRKSGLYQSFERDSDAVSLALSAVRFFGCDGIVSVQTIDDRYGIPHLLEINLRYSGGLSYTGLSGINLPGIFATRRLGLPEPEGQWREGVRFKPSAAAIPVE